MPTPKAPERRPDAPEAGGEKSRLADFLSSTRNRIITGLTLVAIGSAGAYVAGSHVSKKDDKPAAVASGDTSKQPKSPEANAETPVISYAALVAALVAAAAAIQALRKVGNNKVEKAEIEALKLTLEGKVNELKELQQSLRKEDAKGMSQMAANFNNSINSLADTLHQLQRGFAIVEGNIDPSSPDFDRGLAEYTGLNVDPTTSNEQIADALSKFAYVNVGDMQEALDKRVKKEELEAVKGGLENVLSIREKRLSDIMKAQNLQSAKAIAMVQCVVEHMRSEAVQLEAEISRKEATINKHRDIKAAIDARDAAIKTRDEIVKRAPNPHATREEIDAEADEWLATQPHIQDEDDKVIKRIEYRKGRPQLIADYKLKIENANAEVANAEQMISQVKDGLQKDPKFKVYHERLKTVQERLKAISPGLTALELALKEIEEKFSKQAVVVPPAPSARRVPPPLPPQGGSPDPDLGSRPTSVPDGSGN